MRARFGAATDWFVGFMIAAMGTAANAALFAADTSRVWSLAGAVFCLLITLFDIAGYHRS